jgi:hypothetical protein
MDGARHARPRVVPLRRGGAQLGYSGRRDACGSGGGGRQGTVERGGRAEQGARVVDDGGAAAVAEEEEEEDIYIWPRLQVRITGPRRLLPRCARQPAVRNYRGRKYVQWNGGLQVWSKRCAARLVCNQWCV